MYKSELTKIWTEEELEFFEKLNTPVKVQEFLDSIHYSTDTFYRSPRNIIKDRKANCADGSIFGAAALRMLGHPPVIMEMTAVRDDDHLLAIFKQDGCLGAVAKSNVVGLRYREPIYKNLRELVMSYFEFYYNTDGEKTLRGYSALLNLSTCDHLNWMTCDDSIEPVLDTRLVKIRHYSVLTPSQEKNLAPMDPRTYKAGLMGSVEEGLYKPGKTDQ